MIDSFGQTVREFERSVRRTCPDCFSTRLRWMPLTDLAFAVPASERLRVFDLASWCGSDAQCWLCTKCGMYGAFGPAESWMAV